MNLSPETKRKIAVPLTVVSLLGLASCSSSGIKIPEVSQTQPKAPQTAAQCPGGADECHEFSYQNDDGGVEGTFAISNHIGTIVAKSLDGAINYRITDMGCDGEDNLIGALQASQGDKVLEPLTDFKVSPELINHEYPLCKDGDFTGQPAVAYFTAAMLAPVLPLLKKH